MNNPEKFYYIGEISKIVEVPQHILRFWEKEFSILKPLRDHRGHRIYTKKDIQKINDIKTLVYNKGYKIKGAKKKMRENRVEYSFSSDKKFLLKMLSDIREIKKCLK